MLLFSFVFQWNLSKGQVISIYKWENQTLYKDAEFTSRQSLYYDMTLRVANTSYEGASVEATFCTYMIPDGTSSKYKTLLNCEKAGFRILKSGKFVVPPDQAVPNWRNVPAFPERDLKVGEIWSEDAELIYLIFEPNLRFSYRVNYTFSGFRDGYAVIVGTYTAEKYIGYRKEQPYPLKLISSGVITVLWDPSTNLPVEKSGSYVELFIFPDASTLRFEGNYVQRYFPSLASEAIAERLKRAVDKDVVVERGEEGVRLTVPSILFDFDSAQVKPEGINILKKIAGELEKLPHFRVVVKGYTDSYGSDEYNRRLSLKRAEAVAELLEKEGVPESRISVMGEGEANPIAPNTPEKAHLNRRVEIYILP